MKELLWTHSTLPYPYLKSAYSGLSCGFDNDMIKSQSSFQRLRTKLHKNEDDEVQSINIMLDDFGSNYIIDGNIFKILLKLSC